MAFDRHLNLVLGDAEEYRHLPPKKGSGGAPEEARRVLGLVLLRGEEVISLTVEGPPPAEDRAARGAPVPGPGVGRPAGRGMPVAAAAAPTAPGAPPPGLGGAARGVGAPSPAMMAPRPPGMPPMMGGGGMPPPPPMMGGRPMMPPGPGGEFLLFLLRGAANGDGHHNQNPDNTPDDGRTDRGGRGSSEVETRSRCRHIGFIKGQKLKTPRARDLRGREEKYNNAPALRMSAATSHNSLLPL
jgi:hypothetical protein